jgi:hypothetical protein
MNLIICNSGIHRQDPHNNRLPPILYQTSHLLVMMQYILCHPIKSPCKKLGRHFFIGLEDEEGEFGRVWGDGCCQWEGGENSVVSPWSATADLRKILG